MTITQTLHHGRSYLTPLDARLLLQHLLGCTHADLIRRGDETLTAAQVSAYQRLVARAAAGEPIPYLTGRAPFFDFDLHVTPAVLIPRPETEEIVQHAVDWATPRQPLHIVDVGTGSGCIAIALARHLPRATIDAVDISSDALAVARTNARRLAPDRITFYHGSLLQPISPPPDLIMANLPYVTDTEWTELADGVKSHEPATALRGGPDGLVLIRELLRQAVDNLKTNGAIFLEIGWRQGNAVQMLARDIFPTTAVSLHTDFAGHDRLVVITRHS